MYVCRYMFIYILMFTYILSTGAVVRTVSHFSHRLSFSLDGERERYTHIHAHIHI